MLVFTTIDSGGDCDLRLLIKKNPHKIPLAVKHANDINGILIVSVKRRMISAYKKTVIGNKADNR